MKLPPTFKAALRYATRSEGAVPNKPESQRTPESANRIARPKMTWEQTRDWLLRKSK